MKNRKLQNILKTIFVFPTALFLAFPIIYLFNDMSFKETFDDLFKGFWRTV